mgnify:CR=1 FL=1
MSRKIITISREFGSGGRYIGENLARKLGWKYYDKDIISELANQTGLAEEFIENASELSPKGIFGYSFVGRNMSGQSVEDMVYEAQRKVILDIAERDSCVIIGRNADHILKDRTDVLNVFIYGNMAEKTKRICELYHLSEEEAVKEMKNIDKRRAKNYKFYTDKQWGMAKNYSISLNSSELGYEMCEKIIEELIK